MAGAGGAERAERSSAIKRGNERLQPFIEGRTSFRLEGLEKTEREGGRWGGAPGELGPVKKWLLSRGHPNSPALFSLSPAGEEIEVLARRRPLCDSAGCCRCSCLLAGAAAPFYQGGEEAPLPGAIAAMAGNIIIIIIKRVEKQHKGGEAE